MVRRTLEDKPTGNQHDETQRGDMGSAREPARPTKAQPFHVVNHPFCPRPPFLAHCLKNHSEYVQRSAMIQYRASLRVCVPTQPTLLLLAFANAHGIVDHAIQGRAHSALQPELPRCGVATCPFESQKTGAWRSGALPGRKMLTAHSRCAFGALVGLP